MILLFQVSYILKPIIPCYKGKHYFCITKEKYIFSVAPWWIYSLEKNAWELTEHDMQTPPKIAVYLRGSVLG